MAAVAPPGGAQARGVGTAQPSPALPCPVPPEHPTHPALGSVARAASTPTLCSGWDKDHQKHGKIPPGDEPLSGPDSIFFVQVTGFK